MPLYWGDLHSHCSISYGHGTVEQALLRARQQLDFCSITGHAFWPDMPTDRDAYGEIIEYHRRGFSTLAGNWERLLALQDAGSCAGEFIAFPSYEWHSLEFGDHNVYGPGPELPLQDAPDVHRLRDQIESFRGLAIPHHIGYRRGYRGVNWSAFDERCSPFVEIFSLHGCSLSETAPYPMLHDMGPRDAGSLAVAGWRMGHRFGIVGGTDHHAAYPGSHGDGRMAVFADALTRDALWEAFLARRVYAATGDRIDARLFVNDAPIGSVITAPAQRRLTFSVQGWDTIDKVELLRNDRILHRVFPPSIEPDPRQHRYRLRITWGWGRQSEPYEWNGHLQLSDGELRSVDSCFSGQAIVAPQGTSRAGDMQDLPHAVVDVTPRSCGWRSVTQGNKTMRHETTQALSVELDASLQAQLTVDVNGLRIVHSLSELLRHGHSHFLEGWLSPAIRVGPLVPIEECSVSGTLCDEAPAPASGCDRYRLQVMQCNGHCAWLTPIWTES